jgi:glycosyltransferase involved in cell wall biosynthesis
MKVKNNISAVVLTKNEEANIKKCIECVSWCDEILVVDDFSEDKTAEVSEKFGARVLKRKLNDDFSSQRNFGLENCTGDWVLFVDADEVISEELKNEILRNTNNSDFDGFLIKRSDYVWKKKINYGESGNIYLLRLARKDAGRWYGKIHERWTVDGKIGKLNNFIFHFPHPTINEFLKEINFYTDVRAKELFTEGIKSNFFSIILYPKTKFFQNYFLKLGVLDGIPGLVLAITMSLHSFLVRGKLWLLWNKK